MQTPGRPSSIRTTHLRRGRCQRSVSDWGSKSFPYVSSHGAISGLATRSEWPSWIRTETSRGGGTVSASIETETPAPRKAVGEANHPPAENLRVLHVAQPVVAG